jgi:hypothetical protein
MDIRLARPEEADRVAELVTAAGLPTAGLARAWRTWVAAAGDRLLGTASPRAPRPRLPAALGGGPR